MDPNKDFIHIDDVFKNLSNGEERESSGAWLNMKNLLDAEMPVGGAVSGGRSVRRYIIPVLALLMIGGAATYWKVTNNNQDQPATIAARGNTRTGLQTGNGIPTGSNNSSNNDNSVATATLPAAHENRNDNQTTNPAAATQKRATNTTATSNAGPSNTISGRSTTAARNTTTTATNNNNRIAGNKQTVASGKSRIQSTTVQKTGTGEATHQSPAAATSHKTESVPSARQEIVKHQQVLETIKPKEAPVALASSANAKRTLPENVTTGNNNTTAIPVWKTAAVVNNKKIVQAPDGNLYKEERDTFKRIDLVERYTYPNGNTSRNTAPKLVTDTVAVTRIENIRYIPLTKLDIAELKKLHVNIVVKELVPLAKLKARTVTSEHVNLVPLSNYKVASRRVDPSTFNKLIQNTAGGLAGYFDGSRNFYAAVMVGGNASFGNPGAFGMQIGIAGLLSLSERWTLSAELKYMNHYFSNYTLQDESVSYEVSKTPNSSGWLFSGNALVNNSVYKVNSYGSLQMPILLNYNLGRVSVFGGVNLAYAFPLDWEKRTNTNTVFVESQQQQDKNPYQNKSFLFNEKNDFASRFGLGYALGMNYDFSRKLSVDARMTQILVDNARGNTEAINKLFRLPSLQLSLGYYFGRKDKVVYIMDKR